MKMFCCPLHTLRCYSSACCLSVFRYMGFNGQPAALRSWRSLAEEPRESRLENGFSDPAVTPDEPKSEPLPETPSLLPTDSNGLKKTILQRQQSLVILTGKTHAIHTHHTRSEVATISNQCFLTEPEPDKDLPIATVKTQEILQGNVVRESAEGHGTIEYVSMSFPPYRPLVNTFGSVCNNSISF